MQETEPGKEKERGCAGNVGRTVTAQGQLMAGEVFFKNKSGGKRRETNRPFTRQMNDTLANSF